MTLVKIVRNILNYLIKAPAVGRISTLDIFSTNILSLDISVKLTPCFGDIDPPHRKWFKEQIA